MARVPFAESRVGVAKQEVGVRTERAPVADYSGLEKLGQGISSAARSVGAIFQQEAQKKKEADIMGALTPAAEEMAKETNRFNSLKGAQVTPEALDEHELMLNNIVNRYGEGLEGDAQKIFAQRAGQRASAHRIEADRHVHTEIGRAEAQTRAAAVDSAVSRHAADPLSLLGIEDFKMAIAAAGSPGDTPEVRKQMQQQTADRAVGGALNTLLQNDRPDVVSAKAYLGQVRNSMTPDAAEKADAMLAKAERVVANNTAAVEVIKSVQTALPGRRPWDFTQQEVDAKKQIDADLLAGKITVEDRDARVRRVSAVIGDARTDSLQRLQAEEKQWFGKVKNAGSRGARWAAFAAAPEDIQETLRPVLDRLDAAEKGTKTWETNPVEIDKRVGDMKELMRLGKYQNEDAVAIDAVLFNLPPNEQVRMKALFASGGVETVEGLSLEAVQKSLEANGHEVKDPTKAIGIWRSVSDTWPPGRDFDPEVLNKAVKAQLMEVRYGDTSGRAYEAIAAGQEGSIVVTDTAALEETLAEMTARRNAAVDVAVRAGSGDMLRQTTQLAPGQGSNYERERADIMARRLGIVPGMSAAETRRRDLAKLNAKVAGTQRSIAQVAAAKAGLIQLSDTAQYGGEFGASALRKQAADELKAGRFPKFALDYIEGVGKESEFLADLKTLAEGRGPELRRKWIDFVLQEIQ